jgi:hypothetical protein
MDDSTMTATNPELQSAPPTEGRSLALGKIGFTVWAIGFVPLFVVLRSRLHVAPLSRSLICAGLFGATAVAALWLLGRERQPTLRAWRIFFVVRAVSVLPLLLTVVDGVAEEGWPRGRFNRVIANALSMVITIAVPAFLTGLGALIRTYRVAGLLALVAGLTSLVDGVLLLRASWRFSIFTLQLSNVLGIVAFGSKLESYLALPTGLALIVGGIMTLRAAGRARAPSPATAANQNVVAG